MKTAWFHIRRSPYQALAAIFVMTITFFLATILSVTSYGLTQTLYYYETRPRIIAYIKNEATSEQIDALYQKLQKDKRVKDVQKLSKEDALEIYKQATLDEPLLSEFVSPDVFQASIEFTLAGLAYAEDVIREIQASGIVSDIDSTITTALNDNPKRLKEDIAHLKDIIFYIKLGGGTLVGFQIIASLMVLLVVIGMRIAARRAEIEILQLLGATPWFIRWPFLVEGILYGLVGAIMGWLIALILLLNTADGIVQFFGPVPFLPKTFFGLLLLMGGILAVNIAITSFLGFLGGYIATKRYLKI